MKRRIAAVASVVLACGVGMLGFGTPPASADSAEPCYVFVFDAPGGAGTNPETLIAQIPCGAGDPWDEVNAVAAKYAADCRRLQIDYVTQESAKEINPNEWGRWMKLKIGEIATPDLGGAITWVEHFPAESCHETTSTTGATTTSTSTPPPATSVPSTTSPTTTPTTAPTSTTATDISVFNPTTTDVSPAVPLSEASVGDPTHAAALPTTGSRSGVLIETGLGLMILGSAALVVRRRFV